MLLMHGHTFPTIAPPTPELPLSCQSDEQLKPDLTAFLDKMIGNRMFCDC